MRRSQWESLTICWKQSADEDEVRKIVDQHPELLFPSITPNDATVWFKRRFQLYR